MEADGDALHLLQTAKRQRGVDRDVDCVRGHGGADCDPSTPRPTAELHVEKLHKRHLSGESQNVTNVTSGASTPTSTPDAGSAWAAFLLPFVVASAAAAILSFFLDAPSWSKQACYAAEFAGTFAIVLTAGCCALAGTEVWTATSTACVVMVMLYVTHPLSGGNLNPAVSFVLGLLGELPWSAVYKYWASQLAGGFLASMLVCALFAPRSPALAPAAPFLGCHAMFVEAMYTAMLCFVFLNCVVSRRNNAFAQRNQFYGLSVGFVIIAGGYAAGGISGAAFNPAVALAFDIKHLGFGWGVWYAGAQLLGAAVAALLYKAVRPEEAAGTDPDAHEPATLQTKCCSEAVGTFFLMATLGLNLVVESKALSWSLAACVMCMTYSLCDVSGAHFNPAMTLASLARLATTLSHGAAFVGTQTLASILAGVFVGMFHPSADSREITFALRPGRNFSFGAAAFGEFVFTAALAYVLLATTTTQPLASQATRRNSYFGLSVGSCVMAGGVAFGGVSGAVLNPALSAGIATLAGMSPGTSAGASYFYLVGFVLAQLLGGYAASVVLRYTHVGDAGPEPPRDVAGMLCECAGTFMLVFTAGCCMSIGLGVWAHTAIACMLLAMMYACFPISGGSLNPAVSLALGITGCMPWRQVYRSWVAQLIGCIFAAAALLATLAPAGADVKAVAPFGFFAAAFVEMLYTGMLCLVYLSCAVSKRNNPGDDGNHFYALAVAFTVVAAGSAVGGISGACLNPAVALGVNFTNFGIHWSLAWGAAELLGAALAARLYAALRRDESLPDADFESYVPTLLLRCACEFLGVFAFVLTYGLSLVTSSKVVAWSSAAALVSMTYANGSLSGGHYNPAVTLAVVASGRGPRETRRDALAYVATQLLAGLLAGVLCAIFRLANPDVLGKVALAPGVGYGRIASGFAEMFFTAVLAYVMLAITTRSPPTQATRQSQQSFHFGLCIGSCMTVAGSAIGSVSGGLLNPALALGLAVNGAFGARLVSFLTYTAWELTGAICGVIVYRLTYVAEGEAVQSAAAA